MSRLIDYSNERLCFVDLEEKEVQRQEAGKDRKLHNVKIRLSCDGCKKPFEKWLHDPSLAFSFCCSDGCLKNMEQEVHKQLQKEDSRL
jgi:hypothetical protein